MAPAGGRTRPPPIRPRRPPCARRRGHSRSAPPERITGDVGQGSAADAERRPARGVSGRGHERHEPAAAMPVTRGRRAARTLPSWKMAPAPLDGDGAFDRRQTRCSHTPPDDRSGRPAGCVPCGGAIERGADARDPHPRAGRSGRHGHGGRRTTGTGRGRGLGRSRRRGREHDRRPAALGRVLGAAAVHPRYRGSRRGARGRPSGPGRGGRRPGGVRDGARRLRGGGRRSRGPSRAGSRGHLDGERGDRAAAGHDGALPDRVDRAPRGG